MPEQPQPPSVEIVPHVPETLVNVETGEALPASLESAAVVIEAARRMKTRLSLIIEDATAYVAEESRLRGAKTLHEGGGMRLVLSGGESVDYDPELLRRRLTEAGCPEARIGECITEEISYKVNKSVLKQLAGANPDYRAAIESAGFPVQARYQVSVKP